MATLVALLYFASPARSAACLPANTCFAGSGGTDLAPYDTSYMMTCDSGVATKLQYNGCNDCSCTLTSDLSTTTIHDGDLVSGSSSGAVTTDYLQGTGCPTLTSESSDCTEYMIVRHRGDRAYENYEGEELPYQDIGDNCTNYIGHENTFTEYDEIAIPVGCVNTAYADGSLLYHCDENEWGYTYYDTPGCTGNVLSAQTDSFAVDRCDYFNEYTHCQNSGQTSGCSDNGVQQEFWSWYDLVCCPNVDGRECVPGSVPSGPSATPSPVSNNTPSPVNSGGNNNTPSPVNSGNNNTPSPVNSGSNTPAPVNSGGNSNTPSPVNSGNGNNTPSPVNGNGNSPANSPTDAPSSGADGMSARMAMITMAAVGCVMAM